MKTVTFPHALNATDYVSELIINAIVASKPSSSKPFVLGLPTGLSPIDIYSGLVTAYKSNRVLFSNVVTFNMDEYAGLAPTHPQSYHYFMYDHLFNHIDIPRENINLLDGTVLDFETECKRYEEKIKRCGGIDLFLGGIGRTGHLAFNEAGLTRDSITRRVELAPSTIQANARFFEGQLSAVPREALTVGISTILDNSRKIVIIATGDSKRVAVSKTVNQDETADLQFPSLYLREHADVLIVCDNAAAGIAALL